MLFSQFAVVPGCLNVPDDYASTNISCYQEVFFGVCLKTANCERVSLIELAAFIIELDHYKFSIRETAKTERVGADELSREGRNIQAEIVVLLWIKNRLLNSLHLPLPLNRAEEGDSVGRRDHVRLPLVDQNLPVAAQKCHLGLLDPLHANYGLFNLLHWVRDDLLFQEVPALMAIHFDLGPWVTDY